MPRASIDLGSNSVLLLVVDDEGATLHDEARVVGLGAGLGERGMLRPDRELAALEALVEYAEIARGLGVQPWEIVTAWTSSGRRALNATGFIQKVEHHSRIKLNVISGEEEARLTWRGALSGLPLPGGPVGVVDLGGGSTEFVLGEGPRIGSRVSLELGSVRLTEQFFGAEPARYRPQDLAKLRAFIDETMAAHSWSHLPRALVAVAGTATTLAAMELGLTAWDRDVVHGSRLTRAALRRQIDRLLPTGPRERRDLAAVSPERADFLLAGACVLEAACNAAHKDSLRISDGGVRHGLLFG
jgi:exopolyphosphatase/guanosine-5'-triphosphate,3'-diphosphate pyrophosphatase